MSIFKTLGKIARVAVPIAANFIPGVGPLAAAGIGAGFNALTKGGSLKDRLKAGAGGAALGFGGGALMGGTGPGSYLSRLGTAAKGINVGKAAMLGSAGANFIGQQQQRSATNKYNTSVQNSRNDMMQRILSPAYAPMQY